MDRPLAVWLVSLVLVSFCDSWSEPEFCHGKSCPEHKVVQKYKFFEEREYVATSWITTEVGSRSATSVAAASNKLRAFCKKNKLTEIQETWPSLLSLKGDVLELSWFVPPGSSSFTTDGSIRLEQRPAATVYVRVFGGLPSLDAGEQNLATLQDALREAGKSFDPKNFCAGAYDPYFSFSHHNEVWALAA